MLITLQRRRKQRGVILVLVLWMVVILSLIAYSMLFQMSVETQITTKRKQEVKAEALARAGIAKAIVDLRNDLIYEQATEEKKLFDGEGDIWKRPEENGRLKTIGNKDDMIQLGPNESDGYFQFRILDEERLFNLNSLNRGSIDLLKAIIYQIGYSEEDAALTAAAIVDWKDGDVQASMENPPAPEETIAYAILQGEDTGGEEDPEKVDPLTFRNENFLTVDELMECYGVTPDLFFGPGTDEALYFNRLLEQGEFSEGRKRRGDRFQIEKDRGWSEKDAVYGLRDFFTVWGSGSLNLNTAPAHVLDMYAVASEAGDIGWGEDIIKVRRGGKKDDIDNDDAFQDGNDILTQVEVGGVAVAGQRLHPAGVRSTTFRIISYGVVGDVKSRMEAIVYRELLPMTRDEAYEYPEWAEDHLDRSEDRRERRIDEDNSQVTNHPFVRIVQMQKD